MRNKLICFLLTAIIAVMQLTVPVIAQEIKLEQKFDTALSEDEKKQWILPEKYEIDHTGIHNMAMNSKLIYKGQSFSEKYEFSMDFKMGFYDLSKFLFNYVDDKNYQSVEILPEQQQVILRNVCDGIIYADAIEKIGIVIKTSKWYNLRIVSNGGEGVSVTLSCDGVEYPLLKDVYVEDATGIGFVGYNSSGNPLEVKNFKVTSLGVKDYVKPSVETKPEQVESEEVLTVKDVPKGMYDENILDAVVDLGIFPKSYRSIGNNYITEDDITTIFKFFGVYTKGGRKNVKLSKAKEYILMLLGYNGEETLMYADEAKKASRRLMNNMVVVRDEYITVHDLARLFYNALDEEVVLWQKENNSYLFDKSKNKTLATEVLDLMCVEGQITDNGISSLNGRTELAGERIKIGNQVYEYKSSVYDRYKLLGRYVKLYCAYEKYGYEDYEVLFIESHKNEEVLTISSEEYENYENYQIEYISEGKIKRQRIETGAALVYNGKATSTYNSDTFDIENGVIQLIKYKNGYDTVIITEYNDFVIGAMDLEREIVYSIVNYSYTDSDNVELDLSNERDLGIYSSDGSQMRFDELLEYDVLSIIKNTGLSIVIVNRDIEKYFEIKSIKNEEDGAILAGTGGVFKMSKYCVESGMFSKFKLGQTIDIYLNVFGQGVWANTSINQDMYIACLANAAFDSNEDECFINVFQSDGDARKYKAAEKVSVILENGVTTKMEPAELYNKLKDQNCIITYKVNDNDEISYLELAASEFLIDAPNTLKCLADDTLTYSIGELRMGNIFFGDTATVFSVLNTEKTNKNRYTIINNLYNLKNSNNYRVKLYGISNDMVADYAIIFSDETSTMPAMDSTPAVVTDIEEVLYDGEACVKITCHNGSVQELYADKNVVDNAYTQFSFAQGITDQPIQLSKGDIIRYKTDNVTGRVQTIVVLYSPEADTPTSGVKGWMVGAENVLSNTNGNTNPYYFTSNFTNDTIELRSNAYLSNVSDYGHIKITFGHVIRKQGKVIEYTTEDLRVKQPFGYTLDKTNYVVERMKTDNGKIINVNIDSKGEVTVPENVFDETSIRSFEHVGKNCTSVLRIKNNYGNVTFFINKY